MALNLWTADRRLYLDKDGKPVEADDSTRATLLVPKGGTLPISRARELGLLSPETVAALAALEAPAVLDPDGAAAERKLRRGGKPPANKAITPSENKVGEPDPNAPTGT